MTVSEKESLIEEAKKNAEKVIEKNMTKIGLVASIEGYREVWARDSVISLLGAAITGKENVMEAFHTTLNTLMHFQNKFGQIPNYIELSTGKTSYYASDAAQWYVIGSYYYYQIRNEVETCPGEVCQSVLHAMEWCEAQELDRENLMVSGEASDWADLIANHGKVLFPNVLYVQALQCATRLLHHALPEEAVRLQEHGEEVKQAIQNCFRVRKEDEKVNDTSHWQAQQDAATRLRRLDYFLPWVDLFSYGERFDSPANLLAILTGTATPKQADDILTYIDKTGINRPFPVKVLYPPIYPGESDWREYYKVYQLNLPNQYHNGGIWPWVGALYIAALVKQKQTQKAREELVRLARCVQQGEEEWEFNEWMMGTTGAPMGAKFQAWSAGMFLYAEYALRTGRLPVFE